MGKVILAVVIESKASTTEKKEKHLHYRKGLIILYV